MISPAAAAVTAWVDNDADHQQIKWLGKTRLRVLADAARTGGQVSIIEEFCGKDDASPFHVHHHEDEMFWLLQGAMTAWVGEQRFELAPGGFAFLPRGITHAYRFTADGSRALLIATPAGIEEMFRGAGWDLATPPPPDWSVSMPLLAEICQRRQTPIVGPPPADN